MQINISILWDVDYKIALLLLSEISILLYNKKPKYDIHGHHSSLFWLLLIYLNVIISNIIHFFSGYLIVIYYFLVGFDQSQILWIDYLLKKFDAFYKINILIYIILKLLFTLK